MPGTELERDTWTILARIAERARREPQCQFTSLAHLLDERFLAACYRRLGRDRASGVDGVTWREYGEHLEENLRDLVARMKAKRYKPLPAKRVYIPKDEHSQRPLGLPALEDKIVQVGIALILEAIYEADFLDCSYGFRPGRGCHQALDAVDKTIMTQPINHLIDADIKGFFDNVSHPWLLKFLQVRIKDPSLLLLVRRFLKAGYLEAGRIVATEQAFGPLPVLRGKRKHAGHRPLLPSGPATGVEMAQSPQPVQIVLLGGVPELPGPLPAAQAADRPQPVHAVARDVRFTEEPDVGRSGRQGCNPVGESPTMTITRVGHVAIPHSRMGNHLGYARCKRPGCLAGESRSRWARPGGLASAGD
jgi:hypothetical protein